MPKIKENTMLDAEYHAKMIAEAKRLRQSKSGMIALMVEKYFEIQDLISEMNNQIEQSKPMPSFKQGGFQKKLEQLKDK